ncbi:FAD/NAD(P)-binding domain-containing protein [Pilatotrama ljubarskyi]|nr:FAD/NAD(P)-binding domain-containing protein [Pilatotrama ljubarskyi]
MPDGSTSAKPRFRLAIVGGGIAGLTLAVALGHYENRASPIEVHLYEAGPEITTVGAGISVWPRTWSVMRHLDLYDQLSRASVQSFGNEDDDLKPAFIFRKSDWPREGHEFGRVMVPNGSTTMHRADMVDVLVKNLPESCSVHTSKRLLNYSETSKEDGSTVYTLHFADDTTAEADVLIGADGIKSKTRASMFDYAHGRDCSLEVKREECERCSRATPKWTGTVGYRYLIPTERMLEVNPEHHALKIKAPMSYSGKGKVRIRSDSCRPQRLTRCVGSQHIITYPISHGKYLNWIGFVTIPGGEGTTYPQKWVIDALKDDMIAHFSGWEPEVEQMIQLVEKPTLWAIHVVENLPFSVSGRVALMGDAVHAMTTHFGAGGGQAIEDAYILGRLLADPRTSLARVSDVFRIYQDVRLPFARGVVSNARKAGLMYEFNWPGLYDGSPVQGVPEEEALVVEKKQLAELGAAIQEIWQWQWKERFEDQWEEAETQFEQLMRPAPMVEGAATKSRRIKICVVM